MRITLCILLFLAVGKIGAQRSAGIEECEELFRKNNLLLLAAEYGIQAADAAVIQAKIWELPYASAELNLLGDESNQFFNVGAQGQKTLAVEQLIYLGGKKRKEIDYFKSNAKLAAIEFEELLRNLRYELITNFYQLYFAYQQLAITDRQISNVDSLVGSYRTQVDAGNIPMRDLVRLQSLYFELRTNRADFFAEIMSVQLRLRTLTGQGEDIFPLTQPDLADALSLKGLQSVDALKQMALANRTDLKLSQEYERLQGLNVRWQQSLAMPDLTLGAAYDQRGGAFSNQVGLTLGMGLPFWNKNKGNIAIAKAQQQQAGAMIKLAQDQIAAEVEMAVSTWREADSQFKVYKQLVPEDFESVYTGMVSNFQKRNISLLEFTDFMESYQKSVWQFNNILKTLILSSEQINHIVQAKIY